VKGMKAMGNRLSQHEVKKVELMAEEELEEIPGVSPGTVPVVFAEPDDPVQYMATPGSLLAAGMDEPEGETRDEKEDEQVIEDPVPEKEGTKPAKKIEFEITNPDDVDIDDKGQLGLF
jgi:topoisomerase IV subunit A